MMDEMPFEDIKVKELCDRAMIRKSTFYKRFADKYELQAFIVKEVINDYNERIRRDSPTDDPVAFYNKMLDYVFEFAKANQKLIRSAIRSDSLVLLLNIMSQQVMQTSARSSSRFRPAATVCQLPRRSWRHSLRAVFPKVRAAGSQAAKSAPRRTSKNSSATSCELCIRWKTYGNKKNDTEPIRADTKSEQHTV